MSEESSRYVEPASSPGWMIFAQARPGTIVRVFRKPRRGHHGRPTWSGARRQPRLGDRRNRNRSQKSSDPRGEVGWQRADHGVTNDPGLPFR